MLRKFKSFIILGVTLGSLGAMTASAHIYFGAHDLAAGTAEVWMTNDSLVAGIQVSFTGLNIIGVSGGTTGTLGWFMSAGPTAILGFTFGGSYIPAGDALLMIVQFDPLTSANVCFADAVISGTSGHADPTFSTITLGPCIITGCTDPTACNYDPLATDDDGSCTYGVPEIWYDGVDQNCDGLNDYDQDGDGYVAIGYETYAGGSAPGTGDCNDTEPLMNPGHAEICDGLDNDCDSTADNNLTAPACALQTGVCSGSVKVCGGTAGWQDCDATNYGPNYESVELTCDGLDNDCDGSTDNNLTAPDCPLQSGVCSGSVKVCGGAAGWQDCDATNYGPNYESVELTCDGLDNDCDALYDEVDQDLDGYIDQNCSGGTDCNDNDSSIHPDAVESWYDGIDQNCDGQNDYDQDGDTYVAAGYELQAGGTAPNSGDCQDTDGTINPGAAEVWYDGTDQNCDGQNDYDQDGDGYVAVGYAAQAGGTAPGIDDCDDTEPLKNPGGTEVCDGLDNDCNDQIDDGLVFDCNGDCEGTAFTNECGCVEGNTGLTVDFCYGCTDPIATNYDPAATIDDGSCDYTPVPGCMDSSACNYDPAANQDDGSCLYNDCNGDCGGTAYIDDCSECVGGGTGAVENWAMDCAGVCFGNAVEDDFGACCLPVDIDDCGVCFGANADKDCAGVCFGNAVEDDFGACCLPVDIDDCGVCFGANADKDCAGVCFGDAVEDDFGACCLPVEIDDCGVCFGANADKDCAGVCFGSNVEDGFGGCCLPGEIDDCNVCGGSNADMDCNGDCFGSAFLDTCSVCSGGNTSHLPNSDQDCSGDCFGEAFENECGCVEGNTGLTSDFCYGCIDDTACNFDPGATLDDGNCLYEDCNGDCGGTAVYDECDVCSEGNTGHASNSDLDCNGDCFGSAYVNECGCVEGNTGLTTDYCYGCTDPAAINYDPLATLDDGSCQTVLMGDINGDGEVNVMDVVDMVGIILGTIIPTDEQILAGDLFIPHDGDISVLDLVLLVDMIINRSENLSRDISSVDLIITDHQLQIYSDGTLAGVQLEVRGDFVIRESNLPEGWRVAATHQRILLYSLDGSELKNDNTIDFEGELNIAAATAVDWNRNVVSPEIRYTPDGFLLNRIYPNPFNPVTTIEYILPEAGEVSLKIYNLRGEKIAELISGVQSPGVHDVHWDAGDLTSGLYFVLLTTAGGTQQQKVLLLK